MSIVTPAVLVSSRSALEATLSRLSGLVQIVQLDFVDGRFAAPATWPYTEPSERTMLTGESTFPYLGDFAYEIDLMVLAPEKIVGACIASGASRLVLHLESVGNINQLLNDLQTTYGHEKGFAENLLSIGVALNVTTDISLLAPYIDRIDYVQCMGIARIGVQGEPLDTRVFKKIEEIRKTYPSLPIQVDGGVTLQNAPTLLSLGVSRLCVGSALLAAPDISSTLASFEILKEQYGTYTP